MREVVFDAVSFFKFCDIFEIEFVATHGSMTRLLRPFAQLDEFAFVQIIGLVTAVLDSLPFLEN